MKLGIVGLPNVGKSTLFNALTNAGAQAANYAFCTIEPNVGVVAVPDKRLDALCEMYNPVKVTPATIEFVDIAGLVKGASKGEGLGNKFLSHIREVGLSGVRVNAVSPGVVLTDMMNSFSESDKENLKDETPLNTLGSPEDVAEAVSFLVSDKAKFITGQILSVNGGFVI